MVTISQAEAPSAGQFFDLIQKDGTQKTLWRLL